LGDGCLDQVDHFAGQLRDVERRVNRLPLSREGQQLTDNLRSAYRHCLDSLSGFMNRISNIRFGQDRLRIEQDTAQKIIEVVRNTGGQHTQTFELLGDADFLLVSFEVSDIYDGAYVARVGAVFPTRSAGAQHPAPGLVIAAEAKLELKVAAS